MYYQNTFNCVEFRIEFKLSPQIRPLSDITCEHDALAQKMLTKFIQIQYIVVFI